MPPFRSLLVVDAEKFSHHRDADLPGVHTEIRRVLDRACARSGLRETWERAPFQQSTGDGMLAALPLDAMIQLISPFADRLQDALAAAAPKFRAKGLRPLRLRVALHIGMVEDADPITGGISTATNDVNRLLDCGPLREALDESDPDVTFAAVAVSDQAFEMFVRGGHTKLLPSRFTQVRAQVKQFDRPAHLYVPKPSKREEDGGGPPAVAPPPPPGDGGSGQTFSGITFQGDGNQNVFGNQVHGDINGGRS
ncbi:hypothetical protein ACFVH6_02305 [Spirillospora sp. NPDC127200]